MKNKIINAIYFVIFIEFSHFPIFPPENLHQNVEIPWKSD